MALPGWSKAGQKGPKPRLWTLQEETREPRQASARSIFNGFIFNFIIWSKDNLSLTNYINLLFFISQNIEGHTFELFIKNFYK